VLACSPEGDEKHKKRRRGSGPPALPELSGDACRDAKLRRGIVSCWRCFGRGGKRETREVIGGAL
jgi:hypothetical protein